jgi:outer membrane receptor protein involved in Fe transport
MKTFGEIKYENRRLYWAVISLVAFSCGGAALAQTNNMVKTGTVSPGGSTNAVAAENLTNAVVSASSTNGTATGGPTNSTVSENVANPVVPASPVLAEIPTNSAILAVLTNTPVLEISTNAVVLETSTNAVAPESPTNAVTSGGSTNVTELGNVTVIGKLNQARSAILPDLGATAYTQTSEQIMAQPQGENAPFNQVILHSPGVAQDSSVNGDLHVRGEHGNLQYRINGVLLPEGITGGFGLELDPRFVESMQLITGSLPAQYGFRTAGVVDITTKSGVYQTGGDMSLYGGSYSTFRPSFDYGGTQGKWDYFVTGSYDQNSLGIENPTPGTSAIHDQTYQYKSFIDAARLVSDTSRVTLMGGASYSSYQIPNTPGLPPGNSPTTDNPGAVPWYNYLYPTNFNSAVLNENQLEQNYYGVAAYQRSAGDLNYQAAAYGRMSGVHFTPDPFGDLFLDGVASDVNRKLYSGGFQFDASYQLGDQHTVRGGVMFLQEYLTADTTTTVFPVDSNGNPTGPAFPIVQDSVSHALYAGVYLQDEWKILPQVTINYGARFDMYASTFDHENQPSPRVNLVWKPTDSTALHAGYARYFTPPPLENVPQGDVAVFNGTSNQSAVQQDDPVKAERANYFDAGISQKITTHLQAGVDGYYKYAKEQLDDGLFGQTQILSAFNYTRGRIYGVEFTSSYNLGGFSAYANVAYSVAQGENWSSSQFLFDPTALAYVQNHWIYLDHDQRVTGTFGTSYLWKESNKTSTQVSVDALYGSGLRQDGGGTIDAAGDPIPNGSTVPAYYSVNFGVAQSFKLAHDRKLTARIDVVNLTDDIYQLRSGSGVGVNAAQYGERLGFFGSLGLSF